MIDWLTLKLPRERVRTEDWEKVIANFSHIMQVKDFGFESRKMLNEETGEFFAAHIFKGQIEYSKCKRESLRSDTHGLVVNPGHEFELLGSPARAMYENNVFGSMNPRECAIAMISMVNRELGIELPLDLNLWRCTRMDITHNYDLGGSSEVRQALTYLRLTEGGHKHVSTEEGAETVYWNKRSQLRAAKAYQKGKQLAKQVRKGIAEATEEEIVLADRLLRLELMLKHQWWREDSTKAWHEYTEIELDEIHSEYFGKLIGKVEVIEMDRPMVQMMIEAAKAHGYTEGRGRAAYGCWCRIKAEGLRNVQESMPAPTWYKHKQILFLAGLTWADLQASNVLPFRRRCIELGSPVTSWADLRRAA